MNFFNKNPPRKTSLPQNKQQSLPTPNTRIGNDFSTKCPQQEITAIMAFLAANCKLTFPRNGSFSEILEIKKLIKANSQITYSSYDPASLFYLVKENLNFQPDLMVPNELLEPFLSSKELAIPDLTIFQQSMKNANLLDQILYLIPRLCSNEEGIDDQNLKKAAASLFSTICPRILDIEKEKKLLPVLISLFEQRASLPAPEIFITSFNNRASMNIANLKKPIVPDTCSPSEYDSKTNSLKKGKQQTKWIDIYSFHKKYLYCSRNGEIICNRDVSKDFEKWKINELGEDEISIQSWNGKYLCIDAKENVQTTEIFNESCIWLKQNIILGVLEKQNKISWSLTNKKNRKLLCAERNGKMIANRTRRGQFEVFEISVYWNLNPRDPKANNNN